MRLGIGDKGNEHWSNIDADRTLKCALCKNNAPLLLALCKISDKWYAGSRADVRERVQHALTKISSHQKKVLSTAMKTLRKSITAEQNKRIGELDIMTLL